MTPPRPSEVALVASRTFEPIGVKPLDVVAKCNRTATMAYIAIIQEWNELLKQLEDGEKVKQ